MDVCCSVPFQNHCLTARRRRSVDDDDMHVTTSVMLIPDAGEKLSSAVVISLTFSTFCSVILVDKTCICCYS